MKTHKYQITVTAVIPYLYFRTVHVVIFII